jgi:alkanesulfonate monooxygenase SsuD/methylene tetrahydromethanopterin reductase-like flavin-dependent oxidoreductase (luciferase family)
MDSLRRSIELMDRTAARYGRKVRYAFNPFIAFGPSVEEAKESATQLLVMNGSEAEAKKVMTRIVAPAMKAGCVGPPEQVREQLMAYHDMGIELFLFKLTPSEEQITAIKEEIILPLRGS